MKAQNNHGGVTRISGGQTAFTLTELLVTLGALCVFIGLLLPALGRASRRSGVLECRDNLRQINAAMNAYAADHSDSLPGPQWRALFYNYSTYSDLQYGMAWYLAPYMGFPPATNTVREIDTLRCPAAKQIAPTFPPPSPTQVPVSYLLTTYVTNGFNGIAIRISDVFGYPDIGTGSGPIAPTKMAKILRPSENWAIVDLDQQNSVGGVYAPYISKKPVHNSRPDGSKNRATRNYLYFDGSVRSMVDNF